MTGVAALYNVPVRPDELQEWSFAHGVHHREIIREILTRFQIQLPEFVLDPINPLDVNNWAQQHQISHNQMDGILGISGFDLLDVNFEDQNQLASFIFLHASEHFQASNILRIG